MEDICSHKFVIVIESVRKLSNLCSKYSRGAKVFQQLSLHSIRIKNTDVIGLVLWAIAD